MTMAKKKSAAPEPESEQLGRVSVIHLQGPPEERDWLTLLHKKTHLPKATIVRLALEEWAKTKGLPPYPNRENVGE